MVRTRHVREEAIFLMIYLPPNTPLLAGLFHYYQLPYHTLQHYTNTNMSKYPNQNNQEPINWSRKFQGAAMGFASGAMIGALGTVLHARRITPQTMPAAVFMGTIMSVGYAIRM